MAKNLSMKDILGPNVGIDLIAGSVGGAAQVIVGQPLDTIKTRAQIAPKGMFKGPMDILTQTIRKEGFLALYKGMASPLIGIAGVNSLLFTSYAMSKRIVSPFPDLSLPQIAAAGAMAGAANSVLASPVEMFKVRMQGQYGAVGDKKLSTVFWDMWREWGFRKGVMGFLGMLLMFAMATVAREIPAYAGFYTGYEFTKRKFQAKYGATCRYGRYLQVARVVVYATGCHATHLSRVQLANTPPKGLDYIAQELRTIAREGGMSGLFRGLSPSLLRSIPAAASTFAAYELTKEFLLKETGIDSL
ncbi:mitochondrial carrier protein [Ceratobasidium sp. AG-Ba]|nr:mitochondrial carrier protein [Ceratobasidium sp. AG-Ba]